MRDLPINVQHSNSKQSDPLLTRGERDRHVNNRQSAPLLTRGEGDRLTPLNRQSAPLFTRGEEYRLTPLNTREEKNRQASTQRSSFLTQGDKTQSRRQQQSVSGQKPEGQHICRDRPPDPASVGHTYRLLECLQDRHKQGIHLRLREQDSYGDKPPSKKEEENRDQAPTMETEVEQDSDMESDPNSNSEQEQSTEVNKETKEEGRINSPPVDLKPVIWVMVCLLKQLGDLTMDEMKRRTRHWGDKIAQSKPSTLVWQTTPSTYSWWTKYAWILIILMIGVFGGVHSTPGLGGVRSAPGPEFGVHHQSPPMIVNIQLRSKLSNSPRTV